MKQIKTIIILFLVLFSVSLFIGCKTKQVEIEKSTNVEQIVVEVPVKENTVVQISEPTPTNNQTVGGNRDEHGCLGPAGYSYNSEIGACARVWEVNDPNLTKAAKITVETIGEKYSLTVVSINQEAGEGNYIITLSDDQFLQKTITLKDWKVIVDETSAPGRN